MDNIIAMAEKLGKAISESPQAVALREAQKAMHGDEQVSKLLAAFQAQAQKIGQLESEQKPIEPADKQKYDALHRQLIATPVFKTYNAAQVEFVDVVRKANDAIRRHIGGDEQA